MLTVSATSDRVIVSHNGQLKAVRFNGTRLAGDLGRKRTTCQVAVRWAELTGTREECARAAWRRAGIEAPRHPGSISGETWAEILQSLDSAISELVNDPQSKFYIYG